MTQSLSVKTPKGASFRVLFPLLFACGGEMRSALLDEAPLLTRGLAHVSSPGAFRRFHLPDNLRVDLGGAHPSIVIPWSFGRGAARSDRYWFPTTCPIRTHQAFPPLRAPRPGGPEHRLMWGAVWYGLLCKVGGACRPKVRPVPGMGPAASVCVGRRLTWHDRSDKPSQLGRWFIQGAGDFVGRVFDHPPRRSVVATA